MVGTASGGTDEVSKSRSRFTTFVVENAAAVLVGAAVLAVSSTTIGYRLLAHRVGVAEELIAEAHDEREKLRQSTHLCEVRMGAHVAADAAESADRDHQFSECRRRITETERRLNQ